MLSYVLMDTLLLVVMHLTLVKEKRPMISRYLVESARAPMYHQNHGKSLKWVNNSRCISQPSKQLKQLEERKLSPHTTRHGLKLRIGGLTVAKNMSKNSYLPSKLTKY